MSSLRVLVTCPQLQLTFEDYRHRLDDEGIGVELPPVIQQLSEADMMASSASSTASSPATTRSPRQSLPARTG